ncbi:hypothetical protein Q9966_001644 [Columba livia]|nr:hypothetical protein Q9966_001644 [Columba livia]
MEFKEGLSGTGQQSSRSAEEWSGLVRLSTIKITSTFYKCNFVRFKFNFPRECLPNFVLIFRFLQPLGKYCTFSTVFRELRVFNIICNKSVGSEGLSLRLGISTALCSGPAIIAILRTWQHSELR